MTKDQAEWVRRNVIVEDVPTAIRMCELGLYVLDFRPYTCLVLTYPGSQSLDGTGVSIPSELVDALVSTGDLVPAFADPDDGKFLVGKRFLSGIWRILLVYDDLNSGYARDRQGDITRETTNIYEAVSALNPHTIPMKSLHLDWADEVVCFSAAAQAKVDELRSAAGRAGGAQTSD